MLASVYQLIFLFWVHNLDLTSEFHAAGQSNEAVACCKPSCCTACSKQGLFEYNVCPKKIYFVDSMEIRETFPKRWWSPLKLNDSSRLS